MKLTNKIAAAVLSAMMVSPVVFADTTANGSSTNSTRNSHNTNHNGGTGNTTNTNSGNTTVNVGVKGTQAHLPKVKAGSVQVD